MFNVLSLFLFSMAITSYTVWTKYCMWTHGHHTHVCFLNIPFQTYLSFCYNNLQSSGKASHKVLECGCEDLPRSTPRTLVK